MHNAIRCTIVSAAVATLISTSSAWAQQPQTVRVRGTIEAIDGNTLIVRSRDGNELKVRLADNVAIRGLAKMSLSDVQPGAIVGVGAMPQPDGSQKALEVHIVPPGMRITEGHTPYDLRPGSNMTNGTVETSVVATDGNVLTVRYRQGDKVDEKKITVTPDTPIVAYVPGSRDELKPGARIMIFAATRQADGTLVAPSINVGRDGLAPPM